MEERINIECLDMYDSLYIKHLKGGNRIDIKTTPHDAGFPVQLSYNGVRRLIYELNKILDESV